MIDRRGTLGRLGWALLRLTGLALAVAVLVAGVAVAIQGRIKPAAASSSTVVEIHSAHGASFLPALQGKRPLFILALGSDARPGQTIGGQRSDSIHLIGVDPAHDRATILGFPRDSWVNIPGHGTTKITSAMALGGPDLTVRTIESLTGIHIDFWLLTSFPGLINMVNGIGGLTVRVTQPMHDGFSGAFFKPGTRHLNGKQSLAFARDRHDFLAGDLTRSANQGKLLVSALSSLHHMVEDSPYNLFKWLAVAWKNIRTDLPLSTLLDLALAATQVPSQNVNNLVVPATTGSVGAQSVVFITGAARAVYADMRADGVVGS
jgi:LCP family protein required for cell wall assembly